MIKNNFVFIIGVVPFLIAAAPKTPQGGIVRPKTEVVVTHPTTSGTVSRPESKAVVTHPQSSEVVLSHPSTAEAEAAVTQGATAAAPGAGAKGAGNTIPSGKSSTSMSDFKGKQATDFKAAQTGKTSFDLGNGKQDSAKDSTAKNSNSFKGQLSNVNGGLEKAMQGNANVSKSKIANKVKKAGK